MKDDSFGQLLVTKRSELRVSREGASYEPRGPAGSGRSFSCGAIISYLACKSSLDRPRRGGYLTDVRRIGHDPVLV